MIETIGIVNPADIVLRLWPGSTVVIIGGGSSLTAEDVDYVGVRRSARHLERRHLKSDDPDIRVIAIKEAIQLAPWADLLYACDPKWWRHYTGAFTGMKFSIEGTDAPHTPELYPDVQILRNTGSDGLEDDPSALRTGYNSGYQAINLAKHLGASRIVLLGFDMWSGPDGRQNWFHKPGLHVDSPYPIFLQAFAAVAGLLKDAGIEVVNASRFTVMNSFPRVPLSEAL